MTTALLLVDAQVNMFEPAAGLHDRDAVLARLHGLLGAARRSGALVVHVQHDGGTDDVDAPDSPGWQIHPLLRPGEGEIVVRESTPDTFASTDLESQLRRRQIHQLVVAGMQSDFCVGATCHGALARGFEVTLVGDAHSTFDGKVPAREAIARLNRNFGAIAEVAEAEAVSF